MNTTYMRLFIGIACPASAAVRGMMQGLAASTHDLAGIRVVPEANLHITLKFLGTTPPDRLPALREMLSRQIAGTRRFSLRLTGAGAFATALWLAIEPARELQDLAARLDDGATALGYKKELRPYLPHLTVARMSRACCFDPQTWIELNGQRHWQDIRVSAVNLYRSEESAQGTHYQVLESVALSDGPPAD